MHGFGCQRFSVKVLTCRAIGVEARCGFENIKDVVRGVSTWPGCGFVAAAAAASKRGYTEAMAFGDFENV